MRSTAGPVRPYLALTAICTGFFLLMMDITIVNVAVPTMQRELPATLNDVTWINSVYLLTYAVPLLLAGRLGDRLGRGRVFLAGMAVFTAASLACGLVGSAPALIAARAVQGLGAAAVAAQTMALISALFPPDRRGAPMGIWGGTGAAAAAIAPVLGGTLIGLAGWRGIFLINVPVGLAGLVLGWRALPRERPAASIALDPAGVLLSGLGLFGVVYGLQAGERHDWGRVLGPFTAVEVAAAGALLLVAFVLWEGHRRDAALMPLTLFRRPGFPVSAAVVAMVGFGWAGLFMPLMLLLQEQLHLSALQAGLYAMPQAIAAGLVAPAAGRLSDRIGARGVVIASNVLTGLGLALLALASGRHVDRWSVLAGVTLVGLGTGAVFPALASAAMRHVPGPLMGTASGVYSTARQVGVVLGTAAVGVLLQAEVRDHAVLGTAVRWTLLLPLAVVAVAVAAALGMERAARPQDGPAADVRNDKEMEQTDAR
ncbi:DHA2 family efflux MFS transporter permease subunit [Actinomadura macrotermitis]|uniref:Multidrug resistance protein Stp n=1 Tax=Actinomadura macrotermitis TaxID=2585200 RepID=A0A7K0C031_9ACTN|nr:DHA2 family efflux MFS transporter permease subunit [Actinomadura macrotermitis]MQY06442.1 Multidrug resistance protein Stp [Actinomadura macrotermitis]